MEKIGGKNKAKLEAKIRGILSQVEESIVQDTGDDDPPTLIKSDELKNVLLKLIVRT